MCTLCVNWSPMPSQLDLDLNAHFAALTAPGGLFETGVIAHNGQNLPIITTAPESLPALFAHYCALYGDADFLVDDQHRLSFAQAHAAANTIAMALLGTCAFAPGDRVGIAARNSANAVLAYMAVLMAGGCVALLNGWWTGGELAEAIELVDCRLILADTERAARLTHAGCAVLTFDHGEWTQGFAALLKGGKSSPLPTIGGDALATILFTSGSTGKSKGAWSSQRAVVQAAHNYAAQTVATMLAMQSRNQAPSGQPCTLLNVPLFHVTGEVPVLLQSFIIGRKLVIMAKWDAREAMRLIDAEHVSYFVGVPLMSYEIAVHPERARFDLSSCKSIVAGGASRPVDHVKPIREALPAGYPLIGYGLTETNGVGCGNINENYLAKPASTGPATLPLVELMICDEAGSALAQGQAGEVMIRSICTMGGYWHDDVATAAAFTDDGWLRTGDIGYLDEDAYLFLIDRKKDIIIRGGENISCFEVEQAIYAHPSVAEVCVFGLPDDRYGEVPVAVWLPQAGAVLDDAELLSFIGARIAPFKMPVQLWQEAAPLPRLGTEKIDKRTLKARYSAFWKSA